MPAHPKPVVRDPDAKRRKILEAARRLLIKRGAQYILLDDVAQEAGVAKGTLFLYFPSKENLFAAAMADLADGLGLELSALSRSGLRGREMLEATARVLLIHFDRNRDFMGHLGAGRLPHCGEKDHEKLLEIYRSNQSILLSILRAASSDDGKSIRRPKFAAAAFIGLCRSMAVRKLLEGHDAALDREAGVIADYFLSGSGMTL